MWSQTRGSRWKGVALSLVVVAGITAFGVGGAQAGGSSEGDFLVGIGGRPAFNLPDSLGWTTVLARSGSSGENARGVFSATGFVGGVGYPFSGRVTCLHAQGNRAVAGGIVTKSEASNVPVGSGVLIQVTDNGFPGAGRDTNINFVGFGGSDPELTTCPFIDLPEFPEITLTKGDFAVHDG